MSRDFALGRTIIARTMHSVLPPKYDGVAVRTQLLAMGAQESRFIHRRQVGGPATGFWQFEQGGGVRGVMSHRSTYRMAAAVCIMRGVTPSPAKAHQALATDDLLACAFARLLLYTDPRPIPYNDEDAAWHYYLGLWRPGKPHPETWPSIYVQSMKVEQ